MGVSKTREHATAIPEAAAPAYAMPALILKAIDATIGLRVPADQENTGLDLAEHGEEAYSH